MTAIQVLAEKDLIIEAVKNQRFILSHSQAKTDQGRVYLEIKSERLSSIINRLKKEADAYYYQNIGQIEISAKELSRCQD